MKSQRTVIARRRAFTLTELLVAILVLIVVIVATSKIFGTASRVTAVGSANAELQQVAAAIQQQIRRDLDSINPEGILQITSHAVPNNALSSVGQGDLINPVLKPDAIVRCDQLGFFRVGITAMQTFSIVAGGIAQKSSAAEAFVLYSPGFQVPQGKPVEVVSESSNIFRTHDARGPKNAVDGQIYPFDRRSTFAIQMVKTEFGPNSQMGGADAKTNYMISADNEILGTQPEARQWTLSRQAIVLGDDDPETRAIDSNGKTFYMQNRGARSLFFIDPGVPQSSGSFYSREIRNGRFDLAATTVRDVRERLEYYADTQGFSPEDRWFEQSLYFANQIMRFPRAEGIAPSQHRTDQALTSHVIATNCSDFRVEWTYDRGTGAIVAPNGTLLHQGFQWNRYYDEGNYFDVNYNDVEESKPWFGWFDAERGVMPYTVGDTWSSNPSWWDGAGPWWTGRNLLGSAPTGFETSIFPGNIEIYDDPSGSGIGSVSQMPPVRRYIATFGVNQTEPAPIDANGIVGEPEPEYNYTPWPDALRIRFTLHDQALNLEYGRTFEFVVDVPDRFGDG